MPELHHVTLERRQHDRVFTCTCGWEGDPTPYGRTAATAAAAAIRHAAQLEQEPPP